MKVKDIMKPNPITLTLQNSLKDLINVFRENEIGSVIIVDQKKEPYQIVTLRDLSRICFLNLFTDSILEALKELNKDKNSLITVSPNDSYIEALSLMKKFNISHLPVVSKKKKLVGILSIRDIAKNFPELIFIDPLTEVNNRAYLNIIKTKIKKISGPVTVLMIDIDNFKEINDTFGHVVGDKVLKKLAQTLRKNVKITDEVIRYGGEEFLVIAYRCDLEEGKILAERLRRKIEDIKFNKRDLNFKITVSIGLSIYEPQEDLLTAIENADKAMYKAKQRGKNRVEAFENSLSS
uniref:diguanylate cyclase n=1 Tax=Thermodesulfobacterium geofontis TaxID=1295609 RepID=A0A7C4NUG6_9BACT